MSTPSHPQDPVLDRLTTALNGHDLEALVACFAEDYENRTPAHPARGFVGREQVRSNWGRIFAEVPDIRARVARTATRGSTVWSEWEMDGTGRDSTAFRLRGVVIFEIREDAVQSAVFYLEPVDEAGPDADAALERLLGDPATAAPATAAPAGGTASTAGDAEGPATVGSAADATVLVVGGTGDLGGRIARGLLAQGRAVRILVRPGSDPADLLAAGAHPVTGDLKDAASLAAACAGVHAVITTANAAAGTGADTVDSVDLHGNLALIGAAEEAGVQRLVFVSALGADPGHPMPLLRAKGLAERRLRDSAMDWTVLRPNVLMDKLIPIVVGAPALADQPVTLVGSGATRHSFVAMRDVAAYALAALEHPGAVRQVLTLGGPEAISWWDVVAAFETELGRPVPVRTVSPGASADGLPGFVAGLLTALDAYDSPIDMTSTSADYGITPTPLAAYVREFVTAAAGPSAPDSPVDPVAGRPAGLTTPRS